MIIFINCKDKNLDTCWTEPYKCYKFMLYKHFHVCVCVCGKSQEKFVSTTNYFHLLIENSTIVNFYTHIRC